MGRELDSLADVISFGVAPAPACLAYAIGMTAILALLFFVGCGISRLARYNVTADALTGHSGKVTYFEGTPIPTSLALVAVMAILAWVGGIGPDLPFGTVALGPFDVHPFVLLFVLSGSLMVSKTLRIPKL
jgi:CDP-diacylglycerol--serine O-phosphatidyltransferase